MTAKTISLKDLYAKDESLWITENVQLLREGKFSEADWEHIAEELEIIGKSQFREVFSRMIELFLHLLKWMMQKNYRGSGWEVSIQKQRDELNEIFSDSQNLKKYADENTARAYDKAKRRANLETEIPENKFPKEPPFSLDQAVDDDYWPEN